MCAQEVLESSRFESVSDLALRPHKWIDCDPRLLRDCFDRTPFQFRHKLVGDPLFKLERLAQLARFLEGLPGETYVDIGVTQVGQRWDQSKVPERNLVDVIHHLEEIDAWIVLRKAELDPEYRELLNQCLAELRDLRGGGWGRPTRLDNAIVFITSPRRIAAYHIDRECNFLLQIAGSKTLYVFDRNDRDVLSEEEIERFWTVDHNAARYRPEYQDRARAFRLQPGDAVHVPVNAPHWVQNDDNVSITLSTNFQFLSSDRASQYQANYFLRKFLGITPNPPGRYPRRDFIKVAAIGGMRWFWNQFRTVRSRFST